MAFMINRTIYGGVIWTNHVIAKMRDRGLSQDTAWVTFKHPDRTFLGKKPHTSEFQKQFDRACVTVIATQNDKKEWVVISAWIDPPLPGSRDYKEQQEYAAYQKASGLMKIVLTIKKQLGF